jgi:hypothetical protein
VSGFLSNFREVVTVNFETPDGAAYWAAVRRYLPRGDTRAAQDKLFTATMKFVGGEEQSEDAKAETSGPVDTGAYQDELVARALVEWNLTDDEGAPIPLGKVVPGTGPGTGPDATRYAAVAVLPEEPFQKILGAIEGATRKKKGEAAKAEAAFPEAAKQRALAPKAGTSA